ncbi:MAG: ABC transporter permease [Tannerellaceae bacterium]|nr:ABC transporter permease [Tannerellaceae bacterium]
MFDADRWLEIWVTITRNKLRSVLTCLGVFWGVLMLVLLLGAGTGMKNGIFSNFEGYATNSVFFITDRTSEPYKGFKKGRYWNMRNRDIDNIRKNVRGIDIASAVIFGGRSDKNIVYGQTAASFFVKGIYPEQFKLETPIITYGRLISEVDMRDRRKVCVIGAKVNESLFNNANSCGKYIRVNGIYYQIVGVVNPKARGISIGGRNEESVFLPLSTMQQIMNQGDRVHFISVSIARGEPLQKVIDDITAVLKAQNEISPTDPQAVRAINLAAQFATFEMLFTGINILVWIVGTGTLLAGVIGISNIMMVTVKERTKEIGVRRALGAKPANIIVQVMSESLLLTSMAGLTGLSLGVFILDGVNRLMEAAAAGPSSSNESFFKNPEVSINVAIIATVIILLSGLFAGLIPAWRAMQIKAIDAIREE